MQNATVNGIQLAYRDVGAGQPLLLIHAFPLSSAMWERQIDALAQKHRVVALDLRGFGASSMNTDAVSMQRYADDITRLLDQLGLSRVTVAGLSMGGYVAFALLRHHGERVSSLILADTRAQADTAEGKQGRVANAQLVEERGAGAIADQMLPKLLSPNAPAALRSEVRGIIEANDPRAISAALHAMGDRPDSTPLLATIDRPTLVLVGAADELIPPADSHAMHKAIPNSRLVELPNAGHLSNIEAPDAFNHAVVEFMETGQGFAKGGGGGGDW